MKCPDARELTSFVAGSLLEDRRQAVSAHLTECESCRQAVERLRGERELESRLREAACETISLAEATPEPPAGDSIPGYQIVREIHRGGQGVVYQAIQKATKRKVAIKVMKEGPFAGQRDRVRFEREVQILAALNHPSIVAVHDSGTAQGNFYYVMDYISGQPLDVWMASGERSIEQTLGLLSKICDAVNAAHLRGVIHRDLKPANIRIDSNGEPHVLDFGLAKMAVGQVTDASQPQLMTMTGQFVGSLPWASPEQAEGSPDKIDIRTDVYSLGVILYQMLTGKFPYDVVGNMRDVLDRIMRAEPTRPSTILRRINDEVETIVLKCLSKEPGRRYQMAGDIARDIRHYLDGEPIEAKRDSGLYVLRKTLRRYRLPVTVAAGFVLLLATSSVVTSTLYISAQKAQRVAEEKAGQAENSARQAAADRDEKERQKEEADRQRLAAEVESRNAQNEKQRADEETRKANEQRQHAQNQAKAATEAQEKAEQDNKARQEAELEVRKAAVNLTERNTELQKTTEELRKKTDELSEQTKLAKEREVEANNAKREAEETAKAARDEAARATGVEQFIEGAMGYADVDQGIGASQRFFAKALESAAGDFRALNEQPSVAAAIHGILARCYGNVFYGDIDKSKYHAREALRLTREHLGPDHPWTLAAMMDARGGRFGTLVLLSNDPAEDDEELTRAFQVAQRSLAPDNILRLRIEQDYYSTVARQHTFKPPPEPERELVRRRYQELRTLHGLHHYDTLVALGVHVLATVAKDDREWPALVDCKLARNLSQAKLGEEHIQTLWCNLLVAAICYLENVDTDEFLKLPEAAAGEIQDLTGATYEIARRKFGWGNPVTLAAAGGYAFSFVLQARWIDALTVYQQIPANLGEVLSRGDGTIPDELNIMIAAGAGVGLVWLGTIEKDADFLKPFRFGSRGLAWCDQAIRVADELGEAKPKRNVVSGVASVSGTLFSNVQAAERAGAGSESSHRAARVVALWFKAAAFHLREENEKARGLLTTALDMAEPRERIKLLDLKLDVCTTPADKVACLLEAIRLVDGLNAPLERVELRRKLAAIYMTEKAHAVAIARLTEAIGIAQGKGWLVPEFETRRELGDALSSLKRYAEARKQYTAALQLAEQDGAEEQQAMSRRSLADLCRSEGRDAEARHQLELALQLANLSANLREQIAKSLATLPTSQPVEPTSQPSAGSSKP